MSHPLKLGVNTSIFDGHDMDLAFGIIRELGYDYVELAYNQGYVGDLDDSLFSQQNAQHIRSLLDKHQLKTLALGCTFNLARAEAVGYLQTRIGFAQAIGVKLLNACTAKHEDYAALVNNLRQIAPQLEQAGCCLLLENGGDANYDAFALAAEGEQLLREVGSAALAFNGDAGNMVSLRPQADAIQQMMQLLPQMRHCHIKDVVKQGSEFHFPAIGQGLLDYKPLLKELVKRDIPCTLEIPLRMHRLADSTPQRSAAPVALERIVQVLSESKKFIEDVAG
ncbi:sugar phosphate isomerase/epimerase [Pantoea sp. GM01]|uniref:sugar phosphate isomerase/epimerase family protein n=1 Tax=Pantoea sp. GM01 TaxID=1144320 RepID=UPI0002711609|nr:sugar phosphate isomerase/epimerase family protein [Pantoea sp. GM01]EJL92533.1 sugar phosphate isomerase/epimerase [Pantoea sp. GM01]